MILDACRNNPFVSQGTKDVLPGLAQMQAPAGTVIGFATQPGNVASDGPRGGNSPYTKALAAIMPLPGRELFTVFNDVGLAVMDATRDAQQPWLATSPIQGRFYFAIPVVAETESAAPVPTPVVLSPGPSLGHIQSAHRFLTERNYDAAHSVLSAAINLDRKWALPFSYRGFTWMIQGDERKDEALKINGRNDKKIALVNAAIEMYAKALIDLDRAIDLDPLYSPARRHRGNTIVAVYVARKSVGRVVNDILDKAILDLKTSASLDPKSKTAAHDLGVAYNYKGHYRLAIEAFNKAIQLNPKYAAPYAGRCSAWVMLGEIAKAKADATIAADLDDEQEEKTCLKGVTI